MSKSESDSKSHSTNLGASLDWLMEASIRDAIARIKPSSEEFRQACAMVGNAPSLDIRYKTDEDEDWETKKANSIKRFGEYQCRILASVIIIRSMEQEGGEP
jgi:hypothetical protein